MKYHLVLLKNGETQKILEIDAETNSQAAAIGTVTFQACRDICDQF